VKSFDQLAGEATRVLNDDGGDAVVLDPVQQLGETPAAFDGIRPANARVIIFADDLEAGALGEALDAARCRLSESLSAPTFAADEVRRYATAGVLGLATHHAARAPASLSRAGSHSARTRLFGQIPVSSLHLF